MTDLEKDNTLIIIINSILTSLKINGQLKTENYEEFCLALRSKLIEQIADKKNEIELYYIARLKEVTQNNVPDEQIKKVAINAANNAYQKYYEFLQKVEIPESLFKSWNQREKEELAKIPADAQTFIQPFQKCASGIPMLTGLDSMLHKDRWKGKGESLPAVYEYHGKKNPNNWINHYINDWYSDNIQLLPFDEAVQIIDKLGIDTAKLHLLLSAHTCRQSEPAPSAVFNLRGSELIKSMGWDKRTDLSKAKLLTQLANTAWALNCLLVRAEWEEGKKKGKIISSIETSRMWDLAVKLEGQKDLWGNTPEPEELTLTVRPGLWTLSFLNKGGAASKQALYHFGWLSEQIMSIDPYHNELALRIAMRQVLTHYRCVPLTVETFLLENMAGASAKLAEARENRIKRHSLKQLWDNNVLTTLANAGFEIIYDDISYPTELRPKYQGKNPKGYFERFLTAKLVIIPPKPPSLLEVLLNSSLNNSVKALQPKTTSSSKCQITGTDIRKAREEAQVKATDVASYFGKSRAWLCQKEQGERSLSQKEAKEILKAIEILSKDS